MKKLAGLLLGIILGSSLGFGQRPMSAGGNLDADSLWIYMQRSLEEVIKKQEDILGIKHSGKPEIKFISFPIRGILARYDSKKDIIEINPSFFFARSRLLSHELGHRYPNQLIKNLMGVDWPDYKKYPFNFEENDSGDKGKKMIYEGMAEYFELRTFADTVAMELKHKDFDDYFKEEGFMPFYDVGYAIVKPILDKNIDLGIKYLTKNPPTNEELKDILAYRQRILREFEEFTEEK